MITGVHALVYTKATDKVRAFFQDVLELPSVDSGEGRLIFALPPAELGIHPTNGKAHHELYLMCDDIHATIVELARKGVKASPIADRGWGLVTSIRLPGGDELGLYEPRHPTAIAPRATRKRVVRTKRARITIQRR